ncbi:MAG TPA: hypothetical protein VH880_04120 [Anaeromyxobacteraceae bacterium]|jgi:hypothetical protein
MLAMRRRWLAVGLAVAAGSPAAAEPPFLVGVPVSSLSGELDRLNVLEYCRSDEGARAARLRKCPALATAAARAAEKACLKQELAPGDPAARAALAAALACRTDEAVRAPDLPSRGAGLLGPASLESAIVAGLADFIVDRARTEAVEFALDQISEVLCARKEARQLFPSLCALATAAEQVRTSLVPGRMLRDAVVADLRALSRNLAAVAEADPRLAARNELVCGLRLSDAVVGGLERREPPLSLVLGAAERLASECPCPVLLGWQAECRKESAGTAAGQALTAASRLAIARAGDRKPGLSLDPADVLAEVLAVLDGYQAAEEVREKAREAARILVGPAVRVRLAVDGYQSAGPDQRRAAARELLAASVDFLGAAIDAGLAMGKEGPDADRARQRVASVVAMARHLLAGDYSAGITDLVGSGFFDAGQEPYGSLLRMSSLVVEVSAARTSADVARALETAASPAGTWRLRRKKTVWGLSARLGLAVAAERVQGSPPVPDGTVLGFHAPVGIDASLPVGRTSAFGAMLQVLDLGTVVGARVAGSPGAAGARDRPEVGIAQVFAPGAALFLGIGRTPFVLSAGGAWSPSLRPVATGEARNVWRVGASLSVDVPIFMW